MEQRHLNRIHFALALFLLGMAEWCFLAPWPVSLVGIVPALGAVPTIIALVQDMFAK